MIEADFLDFRNRIETIFCTTYTEPEFREILKRTLPDMEILSILREFAMDTHMRRKIMIPYDQFIHQAVMDISGITMSPREIAEGHFLASGFNLTSAVNAILDGTDYANRFQAFDFGGIRAYLNNVEDDVGSELSSPIEDGVISIGSPTTFTNRTVQQLQSIIEEIKIDNGWTIPAIEYRRLECVPPPPPNRDPIAILTPKTPTHEILGDWAAISINIVSIVANDFDRASQYLPLMNNILEQVMSVDSSKIRSESYIYVFRILTSALRLVTSTIAACGNEAMDIVEELFKILNLVLDSEAAIYQLDDYRPNYDYYLTNCPQSLNTLPAFINNIFLQNSNDQQQSVQAKFCTFLYSDILNVFSKIEGIEELITFIYDSPNINHVINVLSTLSHRIFVFYQSDNYPEAALLSIKRIEQKHFNQVNNVTVLMKLIGEMLYFSYITAKHQSMELTIKASCSALLRGMRNENTTDWAGPFLGLMGLTKVIGIFDFLKITMRSMNIMPLLRERSSPRDREINEIITFLEADDNAKTSAADVIRKEKFGDFIRNMLEFRLADYANNDEHVEKRISFIYWLQDELVNQVLNDTDHDFNLDFFVIREFISELIDAAEERTNVVEFQLRLHALMRVYNRCMMRKQLRFGWILDGSFEGFAKFLISLFTRAIENRSIIVGDVAARDQRMTHFINLYKRSPYTHDEGLIYACILKLIKFEFEGMREEQSLWTSLQPAIREFLDFLTAPRLARYVGDANKKNLDDLVALIVDHIDFHRYIHASNLQLSIRRDQLNRILDDGRSKSISTTVYLLKNEKISCEVEIGVITDFGCLLTLTFLSESSFEAGINERELATKLRECWKRQQDNNRLINILISHFNCEIKYAWEYFGFDRIVNEFDYENLNTLQLKNCLNNFNGSDDSEQWRRLHQLFRAIKLIAIEINQSSYSIAPFSHGSVCERGKIVVFFKDDKCHYDYVSAPHNATCEEIVAKIKAKYELGESDRLICKLFDLELSGKLSHVPLNTIIQLPSLTMNVEVERGVVPTNVLNESQRFSSVALFDGIDNLYHVIFIIRQALMQKSITTRYICDRQTKFNIEFTAILTEILNMIPSNPLIPNELIKTIKDNNTIALFSPKLCPMNLSYVLEILTIMLSPSQCGNLGLTPIDFDDFRLLVADSSFLAELASFRLQVNTEADLADRLAGIIHTTFALNNILFTNQEYVSNQADYEVFYDKLQDAGILKMNSLFHDFLTNEFRLKRPTFASYGDKFNIYSDSLIFLCLHCIEEHYQDVVWNQGVKITCLKLMQTAAPAVILNSYTLLLNLIMNFPEQSAARVIGDSFFVGTIVDQLIKPNSDFISEMCRAFIFRLFMTGRPHLAKSISGALLVLMSAIASASKHNSDFITQANNIRLIAMCLVVASPSTIKHEAFQKSLSRLFTDSFAVFMDLISSRLLKNEPITQESYASIVNFTLALLQLVTAAKVSGVLDTEIDVAIQTLLVSDNPIIEFISEINRGDEDEKVSYPAAFALITNEAVSVQASVTLLRIHLLESHIIALADLSAFLDSGYELEDFDTAKINTMDDSVSSRKRKNDQDNKEKGNLLKRLKCEDNLVRGGTSYSIAASGCGKPADLCGLLNPGTICYANSIIQILVCIQPLVDYLIAIDYDFGEITPLRMLQEIFSTLCMEAGLNLSTVGPELLWNNFKMTDDSVSQPLIRSDQQDAVEFFTAFGNALDARLSALGKDEAFTKLFENDIGEMYKCSNCNYIRQKTDKIRVFCLPVKDDKSIQNSMDDYFARSQICSVLCEKCDSNFPHEHHSQITKSSPYLCVQLMRFVSGENGKNYVKDDSVIEINKKIDISNFLALESADRALEYELFGFAVHVGYNKSGHYIAYVNGNFVRLNTIHRNYRGYWIMFNDSYVNFMPEGKMFDISQCKPYLLIYKQMDLTNDSGLPDWIRNKPKIELRLMRMTYISSKMDQKHEIGESNDIEQTSDGLFTTVLKPFLSPDGADLIIDWTRCNALPVDITKGTARKSMRLTQYFHIILSKIRCDVNNLRFDFPEDECLKAENVALCLVKHLIAHPARVQSVSTNPFSGFYEQCDRVKIRMGHGLATLFIKNLFGIDRNRKFLIRRALNATLDPQGHFYILACICWALLSCESDLLLKVLIKMGDAIDFSTSIGSRNALAIVKLIKEFFQNTRFVWTNIDIIQIMDCLIKKSESAILLLNNNPDIAKVDYHTYADRICQCNKEVLEFVVGFVKNLSVKRDDLFEELSFVPELCYVLLSHLDLLTWLDRFVWESNGSQFAITDISRCEQYKLAWLEGFCKSLYNSYTSDTSAEFKIRLLRIWMSEERAKRANEVKYILLHPKHGIDVKLAQVEFQRSHNQYQMGSIMKIREFCTKLINGETTNSRSVSPLEITNGFHRLDDADENSTNKASENFVPTDDDVECKNRCSSEHPQ